MIGYDVGILALALGASRLADEGFISVGMRNAAADATTLLRGLSTSPDHGDGCSGGSARWQQ